MSNRQVLVSAIVAVEKFQKDGEVDLDQVAAVVSAVALGPDVLPPPAALPGRAPMTQKGVEAPPGSWPHFLHVIARLVETDYSVKATQARIAKCQKDAAVERKLGEAERAEKLEAEASGLQKEWSFYGYCLMAMHRALSAAIEAEERREREAEAEAKRAAAKAKLEAEAALSAEARAKLEAERAKKAATLAALKNVGKTNVAAPVVLEAPKPRQDRKRVEAPKPLTLAEKVERAMRSNLAGGEKFAPKAPPAAVQRALVWALDRFAEERDLRATLLGVSEKVLVETGTDSAEAATLAATLLGNAENVAARRNRMPEPRRGSPQITHGVASPAEIASVRAQTDKVSVGKGGMAAKLAKAGVVTAPGGDA